jgi:phosphoglycerol transferase MdoB-like AlkP superfamily enzyme
MQPDSTAVLLPNSNLLFILVESLESWPLSYEGITPNLNKLASDPHSLFADKVKSQARHGISGDGQLTVNTGLLPLQLGVACILYAYNEYPNFAHLYPRSAAVNPTKGTWNINMTMPAYGYKELLEDENFGMDEWTDLDICNEAYRWLMASDSLSCSLVMTFSSHSPFTRVRGDVPAITPDTPDEMRRYLTCIHYADSCIGLLIDSLRANGRLENTTVVITADHAIFHESERQHFLPYAEAHHLPLTVSDLFVPLIICSPETKAPLRIEEPCYQADVYPTVMHAIGCEHYQWKGLGVNLYDPSALSRRLVSEEEAYALSDKIIRNNWFATGE